jgi:hypothetical protein
VYEGSFAPREWCNVLTHLDFSCFTVCTASPGLTMRFSHFDALASLSSILLVGIRITGCAYLGNRTLRSRCNGHVPLTTNVREGQRGVGRKELGGESARWLGGYVKLMVGGPCGKMG